MKAIEAISGALKQANVPDDKTGTIMLEPAHVIEACDSVKESDSLIESLKGRARLRESIGRLISVESNQIDHLLSKVVVQGKQKTK